MEKKQYQWCEIEIHTFGTSDVVRTSTAQINGVTKDSFTDDTWYAQGGTNQ